ncbi:hypothetical protein [Aulosira sp. FACHB-615]|uniref:hypothetical protein n=1 Tax=Aulosira sp. FACHB-615 TaxID=2692777 RepID=UPI0016889418|nr:hypothetical protein [Aulosira sp. FACHB-615]MBD2488974.1 hypothetical protein [Aulosira sp. FACHB-615]
MLKYNPPIVVSLFILSANIHESALAQPRGFRGCDRRSPTCQSTPRRWTGKPPTSGHKPDCKKKVPGMLGDAAVCKKIEQQQSLAK